APAGGRADPGGIHVQGMRLRAEGAVGSDTRGRAVFSPALIARIERSEIRERFVREAEPWISQALSTGLRLLTSVLRTPAITNLLGAQGYKLKARSSGTVGVMQSRRGKGSKDLNAWLDHLFYPDTVKCI